MLLRQTNHFKILLFVAGSGLNNVLRGRRPAALVAGRIYLGAVSPVKNVLFQFHRSQRDFRLNV